MNNFELVKKWLLARTITEQILKKYSISWNGRIVIPVFDESGKFLFNKYRRSPLDDVGNKYTYDKGSSFTLYGTQFIDKTKPVILCEGELDCLALVSHGFQSVSSTGGCKSFKEDWVKYFTGETYICYDTDVAGKEGAMKIHFKIPNSKIINLPIGKDVTDYFVSGKTSEDFQKLINGALSYPKPKIKHIDFKKDDTKYDDIKKTPITNYINFNSQNKTTCLWHTEKTPSLTYFPKSNDCWCFGCGKYFDVIDVVMKTQGLSFVKAVDFLRKL